MYRQLEKKIVKQQCTEVVLGPDDIVLDGDPAPPPQKGAEAPFQFSAHVYCGQTAGCIKMALSTEVGVGPDHIVLDGDPAPLPKKGGRPPIFGWMHHDATWYGGTPQPRRLCVRWGPSPLSSKRGGAPNFSAHVYCGQTAAWIKMPLGTVVNLSPGDVVLPHLT